MAIHQVFAQKELKLVPMRVRPKHRNYHFFRVFLAYNSEDNTETPIFLYLNPHTIFYK